MHCPFACYPRVKELLEKEKAVDKVELAEQKDEYLKRLERRLSERD